MKKKFNYGDIIEYILGEMPEDIKQEFYEELKVNKPLKDEYEEALKNKEIILKNNSLQLSKEADERTINLMENLASQRAPKPGDIWSISGFNGHYALIISKAEQSLTGKDYRILYISNKEYFADKTDVIFKCNILNKDFVIHSGISSNLLNKTHLLSLIDVVPNEVLRAAILADNGKTTDEVGFKYGQGINEDIEHIHFAWSETVKFKLRKYKQEVFALAEAEQPAAKTSNPFLYLLEKIEGYFTEPELALAASSGEDINPMDAEKFNIFRDSDFNFSLIFYKKFATLSVTSFNKEETVLQNFTIKCNSEVIVGPEELAISSGGGRKKLFKNECENITSGDCVFSFDYEGKNYSFNWNINDAE